MSQAKLNALLTISERSSQRGYNTGPNFEKTTEEKVNKVNNVGEEK